MIELDFVLNLIKAYMKGTEEYRVVYPPNTYTIGVLPALEFIIKTKGNCTLLSVLVVAEVSKYETPVW